MLPPAPTISPACLSSPQQRQPVCLTLSDPGVSPCLYRPCLLFLPRTGDLRKLLEVFTPSRPALSCHYRFCRRTVDLRKLLEVLGLALHHTVVKELALNVSVRALGVFFRSDFGAGCEWEALPVLVRVRSCVC